MAGCGQAVTPPTLSLLSLEYPVTIVGDILIYKYNDIMQNQNIQEMNDKLHQAYQLIEHNNFPNKTTKTIFTSLYEDSCQLRDMKVIMATQTHMKMVMELLQAGGNKGAGDKRGAGGNSSENVDLLYKALYNLCDILGGYLRASNG